jgi:hypothetical protein
MYFYSFAIISPWRGAIQFLWTNLNPLHPRMICAKFGYNWSSGSGEEVENVKVYRRTDRQTDRRTPDNGRSEKLTWAFSSGELKRPKEHNERHSSILVYSSVHTYIHSILVRSTQPFRQKLSKIKRGSV